MSTDNLQDWVGKLDERQDIATSTTIQALAATFDCRKTFNVGDDVPALWHWAYFPPVTPTSDLGEDGHPQRGGFLPPITLPRRMWAAGRLHFHHPIRLGEFVARSSTVTAVTSKEGRSGKLVFVTVRHQIETADGVAIVEEQDIVYRDIDPVVSKQTTPDNSDLPEAAWRRVVQPTPALLFRYSALTFNSHRIHYDRKYAEDVEGYKGLVVHGPLLATLLLNELRTRLPDAIVETYSFRAVGPLFDISPFFICGAPTSPNTFALWAEGPDGAIATIAEAKTR